MRHTMGAQDQDDMTGSQATALPHASRRGAQQQRAAVARTLAPLGVQLQHLVDQRHISIAPPLALPHQLRVAAALWRGGEGRCA